MFLLYYRFLGSRERRVAQNVNQLLLWQKVRNHQRVDPFVDGV